MSGDNRLRLRLWGYPGTVRAPVEFYRKDAILERDKSRLNSTVEIGVCRQIGGIGRTRQFAAVLLAFPVRAAV
jgi:hypothetical protein